MLENIQIMGKVSVKDVRKLTGLSQKDFAEKLDIPFTTYRRYEHDPSKMEAGKLFMLCDKTGVPIQNIAL